MNHPLRFSSAIAHACTGDLECVAQKFVRTSLFCVLILAAGFGSVKSTCSAQTAAKGLVLFTRPPSTYPELIDYLNLTKRSVAFTLLVRPDGQQMEIPSAGILGAFDYPPRQVDATTFRGATEITAQIDAALAKFPRAEYPGIHAKLNPLVTSWRKTQQAGATISKRIQTPAPEQSIALTTADGKTYSNVEVTRVNADSISFTHSSGVATIRFENLPSEIQRKYNYDATLGKTDRTRQAQTSAAATTVGIGQRTSLGVRTSYIAELITRPKPHGLGFKELIPPLRPLFADSRSTRMIHSSWNSTERTKWNSSESTTCQVPHATICRYPRPIPQ